MLVKSKVKTYPDGSQIIIVYKNEYLKTGTSEDNSLSVFEDMRTPEMIEEDRKHSEYMNLVRTKNQIKDYCLSNDFNMFWTLTFAEERENDQRCFARLSRWLKYMKEKVGLFDYIFIPERHQDGCIHFHGVTGGFKCDLAEAMHEGKKVLHNGHQVYNCKNWNHGYSTITFIRDRKKTASYITKYVTKDLSQQIVGKGKKKYWSSRGLRKPEEKLLDYNPKAGDQPAFENDKVQIYNS